MSVQTVKAKLAEIEAAITGITRAYAQAPHALTTADLPAVVNFLGAAEYDFLTVGKVTREKRTYLVRVYVAPVSSGAAYEAEKLCEPFFARLRDALGNAHTLAGLVSDARLTADGGVQVFGHGNVDYIGIEFRLLVTELSQA